MSATTIKAVTDRSSAPPPGVYVPAVLFFDKDEEFDWPAIEAHLLRLAKGGVTGILVQGSNGEAQHLSRDERRTAIRFVRETLDKAGFNNVLVIAGTGAQTIRETKLLNADAKEAGAAFALVLTPSTWFAKMDKTAILRFHREIADVSPIPCMIYNFPSVTAGIDLDSDIIATLAQHPNIVGTKLSCGNIGKLHRLTSSPHVTPETFAVFPGQSAVMLHGMLSGGSGVIAALPNLLPKVHMKLYRGWSDSKNVTDLKPLIDLQAKLGHADWAVGKLGGVGGLKALVSAHFGYGAPWVRGPLGSGDIEKVKGLLEKDEEGGEWNTLRELIEMEKRL